jgi:integrase/recombinase XerD
VTTDHLRQVIRILQTEDVGRFVGRKRVAGRLADSSIHVYVLTFKSFFSWCYHEGLISSNPADDRLELPKVTKRVRSTFDTQHIQALLDVCDRSTDIGYRDFTMLLVLFDTGMRLAELASLRLENVHPEYVKVEGKGRKEREIGVYSATSMVLWKYIELYRRPVDPGEQRVFIGLYGEALSCSGIHQMKRLQSRAGLEDIQVHAHLFRHTFAKFYMENGGDLFNLSRELGHSDVQTTWYNLLRTSFLRPHYIIKKLVNFTVGMIKKLNGIRACVGFWCGSVNISVSW